jgi:nucleolar protein 16
MEWDGIDDAEGRKASEGASGIVRQLEEQASRVAEKKPRKQSAREKEWCAALVEKWGEDYKSMFRDRRLNPMQQTEADLKRRIQKWRSEQ